MFPQLFNMVQLIESKLKATQKLFAYNRLTYMLS